MVGGAEGRRHHRADWIMAVTTITDWPARLRKRVYSMFWSSHWAIPIAEAVGAGSDELEAAFSAVLSLFSIDTVTDVVTSPSYGVGRGAQLDRIGRIVDQPRSGADDAHYRFYLRAKIRANKSSGSVDDLIAVLKAMLGATEIPLYTPGGNASFALQLSTPMTEEVAAIALHFIEIAELAGVRGLLLTQEFADTEMFYMALACYVTTPWVAGTDTVQLVDDASAFPSSGTITVDQGTADAETVAYDRRSDISFHFPGTLANAHPANAAVVLVGSPGLGFPVSTGVNSTVSISDPTIVVLSTADFASSGSILVDAGMATEETLAYSSISAGTTFHLVGTANRGHQVGAAVVQVGTGGALERVAQA